MLNLNSPTVQAMMQNSTSQGFGNIPTYYGNSPVIGTENQPVQQFQTPYPSPKDMIANQGQQNIYQQTSFTTQPRNIVGGYNPGYNAAFSNYYNPYMGYGTYGGYGNNYYGYQNQYAFPLDEDARERLESANNNNLTYDEQLITESNIYKRLSRIVSKALGRSDEEARECEARFDIYNKYPTPEYTPEKQIEPMHVVIMCGDDILYESNPDTTNSSSYYRSNNNRIGMYVENVKMQNRNREAAIDRAQTFMYNQAIERKFDGVGLLEYLNHGSAVIGADYLSKQTQSYNNTLVGRVYDKNNFRKRLLENNGLRPREELKAVDRFVGRYGYLPNGTPISPQHDPGLSSCFSYDPSTGSYNITAPNFIKDRLEAARTRFIKSLDDE